MEKNKEQTAVNWFSVKRDVLEIEVRLGKLSADEYAEELTKAEQKAKEMEKEQHRVTAEDFYYGNWEYKKFHDYYNETYGDDK
jgi:hypothetical protein